jgi:hypothetical protein
LGFDVTDGKAIGNRDTQRLEVGREHFIESQCTVSGSALEVGEAANGDAGELLESTGESQVGKHAVHVIEVFAHILQEQDCTVELRKVGRADQALE